MLKMIYDRILVRYGDLTLKGKNKKEFMDRVGRLVSKKLEGLHVIIERRFDHVYIVLNGENYEEVVKRLGYVLGIYSYSLVTKCENDIEKIKKDYQAYLNDEEMTLEQINEKFRGKKWLK